MITEYFGDLPQDKYLYEQESSTEKKAFLCLRNTFNEKREKKDKYLKSEHSWEIQDN